jgi:hypothetical protein
MPAAIEASTSRSIYTSGVQSTTAPNRRIREGKTGRRGSICPPLIQQHKERPKLSNTMVQAAPAPAGLEVRDLTPSFTRSKNVESLYKNTGRSSVRVSTHPVYSDPAKLLQALHGNSHFSRFVESTALPLHGNFAIHGPAVMKKEGDTVMVEVSGQCQSWHLAAEHTVALAGVRVLGGCKQ